MGFKLSLVAALLATAGSLPALAQTGAQPTVSRQIFLAADLNHDGEVDLDEFHKDVVRSFLALDHNGDGEITVDEIRSLPDPQRVALLLAALKAIDTDGNGRLSFSEVVSARMAFFDEADLNHDERLTLDEVLAYDALIQKRLMKAQPSAATRGRKGRG